MKHYQNTYFTEQEKELLGSGLLDYVKTLKLSLSLFKRNWVQTILFPILASLVLFAGIFGVGIVYILIISIAAAFGTTSGAGSSTGIAELLLVIIGFFLFLALILGMLFIGLAISVNTIKKFNNSNDTSFKNLFKIKPLNILGKYVLISIGIGIMVSIASLFSVVVPGPASFDDATSQIREQSLVNDTSSDPFDDFLADLDEADTVDGSSSLTEDNDIEINIDGDRLVTEVLVYVFFNNLISITATYLVFAIFMSALYLVVLENYSLADVLQKTFDMLKGNWAGNLIRFFLLGLVDVVIVLLLTYLSMDILAYYASADSVLNEIITDSIGGRPKILSLSNDATIALSWLLLLLVGLVRIAYSLIGQHFFYTAFVNLRLIDLKKLEEMEKEQKETEQKESLV